MAQTITDLTVNGKDIVNGEFFFIVDSQNTDPEFANGTTWGRVMRLQRGNVPGLFFDIGLDRQGNLYINTNSNNVSTHVLSISSTGNVTITGNLTVTGRLTAG
jgi:hypothetical protein